MPLPVVYIVAVTAVACLNSFLQIPSTTTCVRQVIHCQDLIIIILLLLLLLLEIQHLPPLSCTHSLQLSRDLLLIEVTHTRLTALYPGLPGWASTRKAKPIWILLKQETVSGSGISWAICKSAPRSRPITTPAPHHSVFAGQMPFLPPNQQHQSTEGLSQR